MKKESMRKYSLLGLVLIGASAVTAAVLPKSEPKKFVQGLKASAGIGGNQLSCTITAEDAAACGLTADSRTSDSGEQTSTTLNGGRTSTVSGGAHVNKNSSLSLN